MSESTELDYFNKGKGSRPGQYAGLNADGISFNRVPYTRERSYADRVDAQSKKEPGSSFFTYPNFRSLASFLSSPFQSPPTRDTVTVEHREHAYGSDAFVQFCTYLPGQVSPSRREIKSLNILKLSLDNLLSHSGGSTIVFLKGWQPPDWLNVIGDRLQLEPEFFQRHLEFRTRDTAASTERFSDFSLPSSKTQMMQLKLTTLGTRFASEGQSHNDDQKRLSKLRGEVNELTREYCEKWDPYDSSHEQGTSIARAFSVHDLRHVSLEQDVSICVRAKTSQEDHWIAIVWIDVGNGFGRDGGRPWNHACMKCNGMPVKYWPTTQYRPGVFFDDKHFTQRQSQYSDANRISQNASLLPEASDVLLDPEAVMEDAYYGLSNIFRFSAASEAQFLDMCQHLLDEDMKPSTLSTPEVNKTLTVWNLVHNKQILDRHVQYLEDICEFLEAKESNDWPCAASGHTKKTADITNCLVMRDYKKLRQRAAKLSEDYWQSTSMLTNAAMIDESQKAMNQADGVVKLTTLAFFFVPLTFSTSIFGMNLQEINDGSKAKFWVWLLTAGGLLVFTLVGLEWVSHRLRPFKPWQHWWKKNPAKRSLSAV